MSVVGLPPGDGNFQFFPSVPVRWHVGPFHKVYRRFRSSSSPCPVDLCPFYFGVESVGLAGSLVGHFNSQFIGLGIEGCLAETGGNRSQKPTGQLPASTHL